MTTPRRIVGHKVDNKRLKGSRNCNQTQDEDVKKLKQSQFSCKGENLIQMCNDLHGRGFFMVGFLLSCCCCCFDVIDLLLLLLLLLVLSQNIYPGSPLSSGTVYKRGSCFPCVTTPTNECFFVDAVF